MDTQILARLIASDGAERKAIYTEELEKLAGDPFTRFQWSKYAAILEVAEAVEEVVAAYKQGSGTEPDQVRAFEWMKKGAEDLQITSLYFELALAYRDGLGTPRNVEKFWELMGKAAKLKDTEAMFVLAEAHTKSEFGQKSPERAAEWTIKGAGEGDPAASIKLARRYQLGDGVKRDAGEFFKWAQNAVESARSIWEKAKNAASDEEAGGWTYEDYPDALVALADAYRERGDGEEADKTSLLAADAAREAIEFAKKKGDTVNAGKSKSLPEIMLGRLREFRTKKGAINKRRHASYLDWLLTIDEGVKQVYFSEDGPNPIPAGLVQATFELAIAYQQGIGMPADAVKSFECMARAAKAGHGEAAYLCAMTCYEAGKQLEFTDFLTMGAAANNLRSQLAQALADCELPEKLFMRALEALASLRQTVDQIRSSRHMIAPEDATSGVAHYTDAGGLTSMLGSEAADTRNVIRLYNIAYMNDPKEGNRLKAFNQGKQFLNPLKDFFDEQGSTHEAISWQGQDFLVFIACFSLQSDSLNLWRFYGRNGTGYSVVSPLAAFDTDPTHGMLRGGTWLDRTKSAPPITLYKVLYDDDLAKKALDDLVAPLARVKALMKSASPPATKSIREIAAAIVSELIYLYKDKDYEDEREVRAVEARTLGDPELRQHPKTLDQFAKLFIETGPILFRQPGSSIIIGPKVENSAAIMLDVKHRLEKSGLVGCRVSQSKVSYR